VDEAAVDGFGTEAAQEGDRSLVGGPELVIGGYAAGLEVVAVDLLGFSPPAERCARRGTIDGSSGIYDDRREGVRGSAAHAMQVSLYCLASGAVRISVSVASVLIFVILCDFFLASDVH